MLESIVTIDQLKLITGYERTGDIETCLRKSGVRFLPGKAGTIYTTIDALNAAMGLKSHDVKATEIDFV